MKDEDYYENEPHDMCPKCGRYYGDIEHDYQYCYQCGWDADLKKFGDRIEPTEADYLAGEADILTGRWN